MKVVPKPLTVVFADDDPGMRTMVRTMLGLVESVEVVGEAADGQEAIELVRELGPDLVLLDVNMPRLRGPDAAELIRTLRPQTHIVLHTSMPNEETRTVAERLGVPLLDKMRFDDVIEAITGHPSAEPAGELPDPQVEAAVLAALTARRSQPMFLVLPDGAVPFYNTLAADLLGLPLPVEATTIDDLRTHFDILRPDHTPMAVEDRLMYRAIDAHTPLTEIVVVQVGSRHTTCRAAAVPFFAAEDHHIGTAIYFEILG
ncbi:MAG TPA: response regulator transcription factor [Gaiellaceae bacterium]|nr:response regulator transcription factor [Gaiellaceae bacterium]